VESKGVPRERLARRPQKVASVNRSGRLVHRGARGGRRKGRVRWTHAKSIWAWLEENTRKKSPLRSLFLFFSFLFFFFFFFPLGASYPSFLTRTW
jgi:hypothetical protein